MNNFSNWEIPQTISRLSPEYLQNNDYQNSNIKKVGGMILKQICKINILAHDTGAENLLLCTNGKNIYFKILHVLKNVNSLKQNPATLSTKSYSKIFFIISSKFILIILC